MPERTFTVQFKCPYATCTGRSYQSHAVPVGKGRVVSLAQLKEGFQQRPAICRYCSKRVLLKIPANWDPSRPFLSGTAPSWDNAPIVDAEPWEDDPDATAPANR